MPNKEEICATDTTKLPEMKLSPKEEKASSKLWSTFYSSILSRRGYNKGKKW
jgi:hypothetical protein